VLKIVRIKSIVRLFKFGAVTRPGKTQQKISLNGILYIIQLLELRQKSHVNNQATDFDMKFLNRVMFLL
jgi:hypothetical protein